MANFKVLWSMRVPEEKFLIYVIDIYAVLIHGSIIPVTTPQHPLGQVHPSRPRGGESL